MINRLVGIVLAALVMMGMVGSSTAHAFDPATSEPAQLAFPDWTLIAAQNIGVKDTVLTYALSEEKSIADIAKQHNISLANVSKAIIDAETAFLPAAIAEGFYTEEEAAQWKTDLPAAVNEFLTWKPTDGEWWLSWDTIAASMLDINEADLRAAYEQNQSIAEMAQAHNIAPQAIIDAIVAYETEHNQDDPTWLAELPAVVKEYVETRPMDIIYTDPEPYCSWDCIAAQAIGVTEDDLYAAYEQGQSIADVAQAHSVDLAKIIDAIMVEEREWVNVLVEDGSWTQSEADAWLAEAPQTIKEYLEWK